MCTGGGGVTTESITSSSEVRTRMAADGTDKPSKHSVSKWQCCGVLVLNASLIIHSLQSCCLWHLPDALLTMEFFPAGPPLYGRLLRLLSWTSTESRAPRMDTSSTTDSAGWSWLGKLSRGPSLQGKTAR